jgi:hypothetical protein
LIIGLKTLLDLKLYKVEEFSGFRNYFQKLSKADWFRAREVAALFCFAFHSCPGFEEIVASAKSYLKKEFGKSHAPIGVTLFGLSQDGNVDEFIDPGAEVSVKNFLSSKRKSIEELSYLCLALKESSKDLKLEAFEQFQDAIYEQIYEVTAENSEVISLLLVILYLSDSETDGERILEKLNTSSIKEETKKRVSEIIKSNDNLMINFRDANPVNPPIFKSMSIALYALSRTPLSNVFLFHPSLKEKVEAFLQTTQNKGFKVIAEGYLWLLVFVFDLVILILGFKYWWPLFDSILKSIDTMQPGITKTAFQVFSWIFFLYPFYMVINFNIGILSKGWLRIGELFISLKPETFIKMIKDLRKK